MKNQSRGANSVPKITPSGPPKPLTLDHRSWFETLFQLRGSVIPAVMPRTLLCAVFGLLIVTLYTRGWPVAISTGAMQNCGGDQDVLQEDKKG